MFSDSTKLPTEDSQMFVTNILLNYFQLFPESIRCCCYCSLLLFRILFFCCDSFFHCHFHNCHTKTRSENQYGGGGRLSATLFQLDMLIIMFCGVRCSLSFSVKFVIHDLQLWHFTPGFEPHSESLLVSVGTGLARNMKQNSAVTLQNWIWQVPGSKTYNRQRQSRYTYHSYGIYTF
jgi:hypothetical protein